MRKNSTHDGTQHIGERYGKLLILEISKPIRVKNDHGQRQTYLCKCDCGNEKVMLFSALNSGRVKSCGCSQPGNKISKPYKGASFNCVLNRYLNNAKNRGLVFEISVQEFERITSLNCHYCGDAPHAINKNAKHNIFIYNGIDRVDSSKGYIDGNCVPCCKRCNVMKMDSSLNDFENQIIKIYNHHILSKIENE